MQLPSLPQTFLFPTLDRLKGLGRCSVFLEFSIFLFFLLGLLLKALLLLPAPPPPSLVLSFKGYFQDFLEHICPGLE